MRIVYCTDSLKNSGGIERITIDKANYFSEKYEIYIITTDFNEKNSFFEINKNVRIIDLGINYYEDKNQKFIKRKINYLKKLYCHKKRLKEKLDVIKPDLVISLGKQERKFLPFLDDCSKKIREFHFAKNVRIHRAISDKKNIFWRTRAYLGTYLERIYLKKYDKVVVLTFEDLKKHNLKNVEVIHNFIQKIPDERINYLQNKRVISVGRLEKQKGFDFLIKAWEKVHENNPDWILDIYGEGEEKSSLLKMIRELGLEDSIFLRGATKKIEEKYQESSIYVMSSRYEGLPLVLIEAMANGLPLISFECECGPKDIIYNREVGVLVEYQDIKMLSQKINELIKDENLRKIMGKNGKQDVKQRFKKEVIMEQWENLFNSLK